MRGYVISLDGGEGFKRKYGEIPLTVLAADNLGQLGFTRLLRGTQSDVSNDDASPPSTYPQSMHEPQPTSARQPTPELQIESAPEPGPRQTPKPQSEVLRGHYRWRHPPDDVRRLRRSLGARRSRWDAAARDRRRRPGRVRRDLRAGLLRQAVDRQGARPPDQGEREEPK